MLLWLRRLSSVGILASVFLLGFFAGRRSVTTGARFQQEQWAIDVAADYLQKKGTSKLVAAQQRLVPISRSRLRRAFSRCERRVAESLRATSSSVKGSCSRAGLCLEAPRAAMRRG